MAGQLLYIFFSSFFCFLTERVYLAFAQAQLEVQVWRWDVVNASWGSSQLLGMGAADKCPSTPFFRHTIIQTFCIILRSGMKPQGSQQWPLKCSLLSVLPLLCFTLPSLISGITFQDQILISSSASRSRWKRREAAWMLLCKCSESPNRKKQMLKTVGAGMQERLRDVTGNFLRKFKRAR